MTHKNPFPRRLMAALGLVIAVILAGGVWFYRTQHQQARQNIEGNLQTIAQLKVEEIVAWRAERLGDAAALMDSAFFIEGVKRWLAAPQAEDAENILTQFRSLQKNGHYRDVLLLDVGGKERLSTSGRLSPIGEVEMQTLALALSERRPVLTDLHTHPGDPMADLEIFAPLFAKDGAAAKPLAVAILRLDAGQFLYPMIQSWPAPSRTAETLLVRRDGESVLFLNEVRHRKETALKLRIPLTRVEVPAVMAVLGKRGVMEGTDYRGVKSLAFLSAIPDSPWFMVTKMDDEEAFAVWRVESYFILALMLLAVTGALTTAGILW
ncbi:MAG: cache domain-containing protein, partial [bacterium]